MATGPDDIDGDDRRSFTDDHGEEWTFTRRRHVRRSEEETHIAIIARSAFQSRIVTCRRDEWDTAKPDLARLLARSVPAGGSRANPGPGRPVKTPPKNPSF
ncbi:MAG TPA: hypothetical protein VFT04_05565 [Gemmatimonadales bacterium]|nr:hypothetical protein [Gemmatimonadales bacterium]